MLGRIDPDGDPDIRIVGLGGGERDTDPETDPDGLNV
jgi:hypothetical protein